MGSGIIAENGEVVTDEMISGWEEALGRDEWPNGWANVGEIVEEEPPQGPPQESGRHTPRTEKTGRKKGDAEDGG